MRSPRNTTLRIKIRWEASIIKNQLLKIDFNEKKHAYSQNERKIHEN